MENKQLFINALDGLEKSTLLKGYKTEAAGKDTIFTIEGARGQRIVIQNKSSRCL